MGLLRSWDTPQGKLCSCFAAPIWPLTALTACSPSNVERQFGNSLGGLNPRVLGSARRRQGDASRPRFADSWDLAGGSSELTAQFPKWAFSEGHSPIFLQPRAGLTLMTDAVGSQWIRGPSRVPSRVASMSGEGNITPTARAISSPEPRTCQRAAAL
jgi:hypothetical protein